MALLGSSRRHLAKIKRKKVKGVVPGDRCLHVFGCAQGDDSVRKVPATQGEGLV